MRSVISTLALALGILAGVPVAGGTPPDASAAYSGGIVTAPRSMAIGAHPSAAPIAGWPAGAAMLAMVCPSTSVCYAVGDSVKPRTGIIARTDDGGAKWTMHTDVDAGYSGISCPSTTQCYITGGNRQSHSPGGNVFMTQDGGKTWVGHGLPVGTNNSAEIQCPSALTCVILAYTPPGRLPKSYALFTRDGGKTWKVSRQISNGYLNAKFTCPTSRVCYAFGGFGISTSGNHAAIVKTSDGGQTWKELPNTNMFTRSGAPPHSFAGLGEIACSSATVCYTAEGAARNQDENWGPYGTVFGTTDGGKRWTIRYRAHGRNYPMGPITCPSNRACYVLAGKQQATLADRAVLSTKDAGRSWTAQKLPVEATVCPSVDVCYAHAFTGAAYKTVDGGKTWQSLP